ncbi:MAG TPA: SRPBCC family protein [Solirubrobacteraceae bacterium]|nr:SRPBCC family protein [Solirubrobacteraceae bacterium]
MRIAAPIEIAAPPEAVWGWISDPAKALHFFSGVTRWEVVSDDPIGLGARYRMLLRVGSAEVGGLIEVIEFNANRDMAWTSVTGLDQRGRWRLRPRPGGRTRVELRLSYGVAGAGIFGWISERVGAPTVRGHLQRTVRQLKRQVEQEETRRRAAERRRARASA